MRKLKVKPTPAGARILRALDENLGLFVCWHGRMQGRWRQGWFTGTNYMEFQRELGTLRASTLKKLLAEEHIELTKDTDIYYGITALGSDWVAKLRPEDFTSKPLKISAYVVMQAIRHRFNEPDWFVVEELSVGSWGLRRIDAFALRIRAGSVRDMTSYLTTIAMEIKVSRQDFLHELKDRTKREPAMDIASRFIFVAPAGLIKTEEVPEGCGLLEVYSKRRTRMKVRPPYSTPIQPDWLLVATFCRAILKVSCKS